MSAVSNFIRKEPEYGNRSKQYLGLELFLEPDFFALTRSRKTGEYYRDSRISLFNRAMQEAEREKLAEYAKNHNISKADLEKEWTLIVAKATKSATAKARSLTSMGMTKEQCLSVKKHELVVRESFVEGLSKIVVNTMVRKGNSNAWENKSFELADLNIGFRDSWVYLRKDGVCYRIGRTSDLDRRDKEYGIHSKESRRIAAYKECDVLNERSVHQLFSDKRDRGEFFNLNKEDLAKFSSREILLQAIEQTK